MRKHRCLLVLLGCYAAVVFPVAMALDRPPGDLRAIGLILTFTTSFSLIGLLLALLLAARSALERPRAAMAQWWRLWWKSHGPGAVAALAGLPALMMTFFTAKQLIPVIHPFAWDAEFAELDRLLHGAQPWQILHPILGHPQITNALSLVYSYWIFLMLGAWVVWALVEHPQRMRFLISYALCWILLGTVAATALSSAGPMFYAELTGDTTIYGDLMAYLRATHEDVGLFSIVIRDELWNAYTTGVRTGGTGISAMPSLHVAIVTLCAISSWYVSWRVGLATTFYAVVIFLGSIHLGWHYAVDGYASMIAVGAIWYFVGIALRRRQQLVPAPASSVLGGANPASSEARA